MTEENKMEKIVSLAKRRGFIYQGSEIYGGLAGTWDYGPNGLALKNNIKNLWWKMFVDSRSDMYGIDASIVMPKAVWEASGHLGEGFADPMVECKKCKKRFREDQLKDTKKCESCGGKLGEARSFNLMFPIVMGASGESSSVAYLRGETAQGIFTNFKNIIDTFHPKLPFGIAQIGKAFRNEIAPRDFIFRTREFEQMEIEWFIREKDWKKSFEKWLKGLHEWTKMLGLDQKKVSEHEHPKEELSHYSKRTVDIEYEYPFGKSELYGLAYRTDFDLSTHQKNSGVDLQYYDQEANEKFIPHVVEPSLGVDRTVLAVLDSAYTEEKVGDETRVVMKFKPELAPVKIAVLPLMKKDELKKKAMGIYEELKNAWNCQYDETGSIGKRYRRQDEIGTPFCVTVDYDSLEDGAITVRDRDSMKQERIKIDVLQEYFNDKFSI